MSRTEGVDREPTDDVGDGVGAIRPARIHRTPTGIGVSARMAETLVRQLGHHLELSHSTSDDNAASIMFPRSNGSGLADKNLRTDQIEEMKQKLARNIARHGDRN